MLVKLGRYLYTAPMRDELKRLKKAVRDKCLECSGGTAAEVALCELEDCPLFPFRMELWPSLFETPGADAATAEGCPAQGDESADKPEQFKLF